MLRGAPQVPKPRAAKQTTMVGDEYTKWVAKEEKRHEGLMAEAGFLAKK